MVINNTLDAPRDIKQCQNMKYYVNSLNRPGQSRNNVADDVQTVLNIIHENPFIQEIIQSKGKHQPLYYIRRSSLKILLIFVLIVHQNVF